jgi:hypothetical protein
MTPLESVTSGLGNVSMLLLLGLLNEVSDGINVNAAYTHVSNPKKVRL